MIIPTEYSNFLNQNILVLIVNERIYFEGLCWGENAQVHQKEKFPYHEAALRSTQLWHNLTQARVVITIVYNGQHPTEVNIQ